MISSEPSIFGALLRQHRVAAGLTQEALAERAGLSVHAVSNLERGERRVPYPHTVRQLARALRLSAADRARLEATIPPRRGSNGAGTAEPAPATNLPLALTSFVGRDDDLAAVRRLLGAHRLVTLTGAGGVGKTRLALEAARAARAGYPDGVWLVELAALADPDLVPAAAAGALGARELPGRPPTEALVGWLAGKRLLLLLDNCEHLVAACAALAEALLRACPGLTVLVTSREALRLGGELTWRVPSLPAPPDTAAPTPAELARYAAARLFVERARYAEPRLALTAAGAAAVAAICRRLDGLPLAIELAAARVAALTVEQVAARLDDAFRLLTGGSRTAPPRQRTLRAAIDWSHDLLTEADRALFRRLAAFAGGWTLEAAEAVCPGDGVAREDVLDLLTRLVEQSLAQVEERDGAARYRLLEPIRQYAAERLEEAEEAAAVRDRHGDWCLALAECAEPALRGPDQIAWFGRLDAERDNLRAALAWLLGAGGPAGAGGGAQAAEAALRLAVALGRFWLHRHPHEGASWLGRALANGRERPTAARAEALRVAAGLQPAARQLALLEESAALHRTLGDARSMALTLAGLGSHLRSWGIDRAGGAARLAEGLRLARAVGDRWLVAEVLWTEAISADMAHAGERARAAAAAEESLALFGAVGDRLGVGQAQRCLGWAARARGDYARARAAFAATVTEARALADREGIAHGLIGLAAVARAQGDLAGAAALYREGLAQRRDLGPTWKEGDGLDGLAAAAVAQGRPARAARLLGAAEALRAAIGTPLPPIEQPGHEEPARAARAALGAAAFAAAWAEGQALTPREAVAYALADEPAPAPTAGPEPPPAPTAGPEPPVIGLTRREVEVLRLLGAGRANRAIAAELSLSVRTVERHVANLYAKIDAANRAEAAAYAVRRGLA